MLRYLVLPFAVASGLAACSPARCRCADAARLGVPATPQPEPEPAEIGPASGVSASAPSQHPGVVWQFRAGASILARATLGRDGEVSVGTSEGYLHRLRADGSFRWSYTVRGAAHAPAVAGDSDITFVATNSDRIYALRPEGTLAWVFPAAFGIDSDLSLGPNGHLYFMGKDQHLYAVSQRGGVVLRLRVGDATAGPVASKDAIWLGTRQGALFSTTGVKSGQVPLGREPITAISEFQSGVYALSGTALFRLEPAVRAASEPLSGAPAGRFLTAGAAELAVVDENNRLHWLDGVGRVTRSADLPEAPSAKPLLYPSGRVLVPTASGAVLIVDPGSGVRRLAVAASPLFELSWDANREYVVVTASEGLVSAIAPDS